MAGSATLSALPRSTIRLIGSTQVITSVFSVIKELVENSLDAGATNVEVKLENYGLDKIEIQDNGSGIKPEDVEFVGQRHFTSKITSHSDLEQLTTYGFRGEALASLCAVSEVTMTTKTASDDVGMTYSLTNEGIISTKKPSHLGQGTTISACQLFANLPVRRQYYNTAKKKKEELKKVEDLLMSYGVILPGVRLTVRHNKEVVWQKSVLPDTKAVLRSVLGASVVNSLERRVCHLVDPKVDIMMYIPKPGSSVHDMSRANTDRCFLSVNNRPVEVKELHKLVRQYYCTCHNIDSPRHPVYFIAINLLPSEIDVNIDPNKTQVRLQHLDAVKKCIESELLYMYGPLENQPSWKYADPAAKVKASDEVIDLEDRVGKYMSSKHVGEEIVDGTKNRTESKNMIIENSVQKDHTNNSSVEISCIDFESIVGEWDDEMELPETNKSDKYISNKATVGVLDSEHSEDRQDVLDSDRSNDKIHKVDEGNKDVIISDHPGNKIQDVRERLHEDSDQSIDMVLKDVTECNKDVVDSEHTLGLIDIDLGQFNIEAEELDEIFSPTQQRRQANEANALNSGPEVAVSGPQASESGPRASVSGPQASESEPRASVSGPRASESGSRSDAIRTGGQPVPSTSLNCDSWSRGHGLTASGGKHVQPVTLLPPTANHTPGKRPASPFHSAAVVGEFPPPAKRPSIDRGQTSILEMLEGQNQSSSFKTFAKDKIEAVQGKNPDADGDEVAAILKDTWDALSSVEQQKYRHLRWNEHSEELRVKKISNKVKKYMNKGRGSARDHLLSSKKDIPRKELKQSVEVAFSLSELKHTYTQAFRESNIGDEKLLATLKKLALESWTPSNDYIQDTRITRNGFNVRCHRDEGREFTAEVVGMATDVPMFGIADLSEILDLIQHTGANTLKKSRPLKVINFLKSEAVRMMRQSSADRDALDIDELLSQIEAGLPDGCTHCLHEKPFFHLVFDLLDVPVTSSQRPVSPS